MSTRGGPGGAGGGRRARRGRALRRAVLAMAVAGAAGLLLHALPQAPWRTLAAAAVAPRAPIAVRIVPAARAAIDVVWRVDRAANPPCAVAFGPALAEANLWNVRAAVDGAACTGSFQTTGTTTGAVAWRYLRGSLTMTATLQKTDLVAPSAAVAAYPELIYGWSPFAGIASRQGAALRFPLTVGRLPGIVLTTEYRVCGACLARMNADLAYDVWLSSALRPTWCGSCVPASTVEVMVWLAHTAGVRPVGGPRPAGALVAKAWLRGAGRWRLGRLDWTTYVCVAGSPACATHSVVSFVLNGSREGMPSAYVGLFLRPFLSQALAALRRGSGPLHATPLYVNGIELGSEVGPGSAGHVVDFGSLHFAFSLRRYCLVVVGGKGRRPPAC